MGIWSQFATEYVLSTPVCVWTDEASSSYQITASDAEQAGSFDLENGTGSFLPFTVEWQNENNVLSWDALQADTPSSDTYTFDTVEDCGGGANTAMRIRVIKLDFDNAAAGVYSGSIVLTILPQ